MGRLDGWLSWKSVEKKGNLLAGKEGEAAGAASLVEIMVERSFFTRLGLKGRAGDESASE